MTGGKIENSGSYWAYRLRLQQSRPAPELRWRPVISAPSSASRPSTTSGRASPSPPRGCAHGVQPCGATSAVRVPAATMRAAVTSNADGDRGPAGDGERGCRRRRQTCWRRWTWRRTAPTAPSGHAHGQHGATLRRRPPPADAGFGVHTSDHLTDTAPLSEAQQYVDVGFF